LPELPELPQAASGCPAATPVPRADQTEQEALLVPKLALACFQAAYERWVRDPGLDLPTLVDESFAGLGGLAG
jgi:MftR C-terminal domain